MTYIALSDSRCTSSPRLASVLFTLMLTLLGLAGCGSNAANPPAADPHTFTGSWGVYSTSSTSSMGIEVFVGNLEISNGVVSGTLNALTGPYSSCVESLESSNVKGTIDASNNLTLTVPISTGVATITATLPANPQAYVTGSYQIDGGGTQCAMPATPMIIAQFAPITGTYSGTLNVYESAGVTIPGSAVTISAVLTQSAFPDIYGQYLIAGTVSSSGACTETVALRQGGAIGGLMISDVLLGGLDPVSDKMVYASFQDSSSVDAKCNQYHEGTLTRQ